MKVGVVYMGVHVSGCLKEELAWATDKWLRVISNNYNVIYNNFTANELKMKPF